MLVEQQPYQQQAVNHERVDNLIQEVMQAIADESDEEVEERQKTNERDQVF